MGISMNVASRHYSALLYELADEILEEEGCVTVKASYVSDAALRIDEQTLCIRVLRVAFEAARERIAIDRGALFECHMDFTTGRVEDEPGKQGLAEYDEVLGRIDAVLKESAL